jgi:hypothetical protein
MNRRLFHAALISVALLSFAASIRAGGWGIVTFETLPDHFVAGQASTLIFTVRQHGLTLTSIPDLQVTATSAAGATTQAKASPTGRPGEHRVDLTVPGPGAWTVSIDPGFSALEGLLPISAIRPGEAPVPLSEVERGERLFVSKGCLGCHLNNEIAVKNLIQVGPDLTGRRFPVDYLRGVLSNPSTVLMQDPEKWGMPNLKLREEEVAALTAFINRPRNVVASKR